MLDWLSMLTGDRPVSVHSQMAGTGQGRCTTPLSRGLSWGPCGIFVTFKATFPSYLSNSFVKVAFRVTFLVYLLRLLFESTLIYFRKITFDITLRVIVLSYLLSYLCRNSFSSYLLKLP